MPAREVSESGLLFLNFQGKSCDPSVDHLQVHPDDTKAALEEETWFMSPTLKKKKMTLFGKTSTRRRRTVEFFERLKMQQANTTARGIYEQTEWHVYETMN